jgi:hypothetical protein
MGILSSGVMLGGSERGIRGSEWKRDAPQWQVPRPAAAHQIICRCAAVSEITIKSRGQHFWNWEIDLYQGNDPAWLKPHLHALLMDIRARRQEADRDGPDMPDVTAQVVV